MCRMSSAHVLVLATYNRKKREELAGLLAPHPFEVRTLADFPDAVEVVEDGITFADNACAKATQQAVHLGKWALGEDSGIVVGALDGAPGVYSARFAGPEATDDSNNALLLEQLKDTPTPRRTAHYVCHMAVSDPRGRIHAECEQHCHGRITFAPAGTAGFGYDPLFEIVEYHATFGQLGTAVKAVLSHRGRAMRSLISQLLRLVRDGIWT